MTFLLQIGLWIPPFPTRAGSTYQLTRKFDAHAPGSMVKLNDGTQVSNGSEISAYDLSLPYILTDYFSGSQTHGGVRVIKMRGDPTGLTTGRHVVTAGADGFVNEWELAEVTGTRKDGTPLRGVNLKRMPADGSRPGADIGPEAQKRYQLANESYPYNASSPPMIVALDTHPLKAREYIAGTVDCDIWEVDETPRVLVEGHEEDVWRLATHPTKPNIFATTCESGKV